MGEPFYHDTILNKLDVYHSHDGRNVFYSPESFANTEVWNNIPVIYAPSFKGEKIIHPNFTDVLNGTLPEGYSFCGSVDYAYIPYEGEKRICGSLRINNVEVETLARNGKLSLSTAFTAERISDGEVDRIVGTITPNHVLVFERGVCPTCWANDDGAMFLNITREENKMTNPIDSESKGWLKSIYDKICNTIKPESVETPEAPEPTENKNMENTKQMETLVAQNTALEEENAKLKEKFAQQEKDQLWNTVKVSAGIPEGWLGEKEPETRKLFENSKDEFYIKLMNHKTQAPPSNKPAEGDASAGKPCGCDLKNTIDTTKNKTGYEIIVGDE